MTSYIGSTVIDPLTLNLGSRQLRLPPSAPDPFPLASTQLLRYTQFTVIITGITVTSRKQLQFFIHESPLDTMKIIQLNLNNVATFSGTKYLSGKYNLSRVTLPRCVLLNKVLTIWPKTTYRSSTILLLYTACFSCLDQPSTWWWLI
jgi:hypothetical protein